MKLYHSKGWNHLLVTIVHDNLNFVTVKVGKIVNCKWFHPQALGPRTIIFWWSTNLLEKLYQPLRHVKKKFCHTLCTSYSFAYTYFQIRGFTLQSMRANEVLNQKTMKKFVQSLINGKHETTYVRQWGIRINKSHQLVNTYIMKKYTSSTMNKMVLNGNGTSLVCYGWNWNIMENTVPNQSNWSKFILTEEFALHFFWFTFFAILSSVVFSILYKDLVIIICLLIELDCMFTLHSL